MVLKLEFEVKGDGHPNSPLPGCSCVGVTVWWCFKTNFLSFIPSLNLLKISFNFICTPALNCYTVGISFYKLKS